MLGEAGEALRWFPYPWESTAGSGGDGSFSPSFSSISYSAAQKTTSSSSPSLSLSPLSTASTSTTARTDATTTPSEPADKAATTAASSPSDTFPNNPDSSRGHHHHLPKCIVQPRVYRSVAKRGAIGGGGGCDGIAEDDDNRIRATEFRPTGGAQEAREGASREMMAIGSCEFLDTNAAPAASSAASGVEMTVTLLPGEKKPEENLLAPPPQTTPKGMGISSASRSCCLVDGGGNVGAVVPLVESATEVGGERVFGTGDGSIEGFVGEERSGGGAGGVDAEVRGDEHGRGRGAVEVMM